MGGLPLYEKGLEARGPRGAPPWAAVRAMLCPFFYSRVAPPPAALSPPQTPQGAFGRVYKGEEGAAHPQGTGASSRPRSPIGALLLGRTQHPTAPPKSSPQHDLTLCPAATWQPHTTAQTPGLWRGSVVAVKATVLPARMSGAEKRERMAIMEAAISSAMNHPNIVQVCLAVFWGAGGLVGDARRRHPIHRAPGRPPKHAHTPAFSTPPSHARPPAQTDALTLPLPPGRAQTYTYTIKPTHSATPFGAE